MFHNTLVIQSVACKNGENARPIQNAGLDGLGNRSYGDIGIVGEQLRERIDRLAAILLVDALVQAVSQYARRGTIVKSVGARHGNLIISKILYRSIRSRSY